MSRLSSPITRTVLPLSVVLGIFALVAAAARTNVSRERPEAAGRVTAEADPIVGQVDRILAQKWADAGITPANPADDLTVLRRLSQVLHGTVPSLEEIRLFESDLQPKRMERWVERLLNDRRFADYFARRMARVFVGADDGQFLVFRRDRFWAWLTEQLHNNRPYDEVVREMIADRGLWTGVPQVNFITAAVHEKDIDVNKLASRTVRAFLGQRIDCAQCHDHPFADWKQSQFEGIAACYHRVSISPVGVEDNQKDPYKVQDRKTLKDREIAPSVPFYPELFPEEGTERQRLATWVTHPENRRFERATVNRIWGLMFGKPWVDPVDDLPNPEKDGRQATDMLDVLGADFREHHCDLKRLIATIAASHAFRLTSEHPLLESESHAESVEQNWAAFPLTRLRPEQVIGAMLQASSIKTIDQNSHWVRRAFRFFQELNFVKEYGDLGESELGEHSGTIPQALLRMNGEFAKDRSEGNPFSAPGRIAGMSPTDEGCLDLCFLVCLTRYPTGDERLQIQPQLEGKRGDARKNAVEDIFWTLYNSAEFNWGH
ncbi:MAG: DUF1549 domain-containing protein [Planctomycetota bacterium]